MREILFRGKRISDGSWVYGGINKVFHPNYNHDSYRDFELQKPNCYCICADNKDIFVEQNTIGQQISLSDKNGKDIYEGDILDCGKFIGVVEYDRIIAAFVIRINDSTELNEGDVARKQQIKYTKVIGNIHDNPELLEE